MRRRSRYPHFYERMVEELVSAGFEEWKARYAASAVKWALPDPRSVAETVEEALKSLGVDVEYGVVERAVRKALRGAGGS